MVSHVSSVEMAPELVSLSVRLPVSVRIFRILGGGDLGSRLGVARNFFFPFCFHFKFF